MDTSTGTMKLPCVLTTEERDIKARELARELDHQNGLKEAKSASSKEYAAEIKESEREVSRLASMVRSGVEDRIVPIEVRKIWEDNSIEVWRLDTNERVSRRAMDASERQAEMFARAEQEQAAAASADKRKRKRGEDPATEDADVAAKN